LSIARSASAMLAADRMWPPDAPYEAGGRGQWEAPRAATAPRPVRRPRSGDPREPMPQIDRDPYRIWSGAPGEERQAKDRGLQGVDYGNPMPPPPAATMGPEGPAIGQGMLQRLRMMTSELKRERDERERLQEEVNRLSCMEANLRRTYEAELESREDYYREELLRELTERQDQHQFALKQQLAKHDGVLLEMERKLAEAKRDGPGGLQKSAEEILAISYMGRKAADDELGIREQKILEREQAVRRKEEEVLVLMADREDEWRKRIEATKHMAGAADRELDDRRRALHDKEAWLEHQSATFAPRPTEADAWARVEDLQLRERQLLERIADMEQERVSRAKLAHDAAMRTAAKEKDAADREEMLQSKIAALTRAARHADPTHREDKMREERDEAQRQLHALEQQVGAANQRAEDLQREVDHSKSCLDEMATQAARRERLLCDKIQKLEQQVSELSSKLDEAQRSLDAANRSGAQAAQDAQSLAAEKEKQYKLEQLAIREKIQDLELQLRSRG